MDNRSDSDSEYFTADEMSDNESCEFILSTSPNGTPWIIPNPCFLNSHKVTVQIHYESDVDAAQQARIQYSSYLPNYIEQQMIKE